MGLSAARADLKELHLRLIPSDGLSKEWHGKTAGQILLRWAIQWATKKDPTKEMPFGIWKSTLSSPKRTQLSLTHAPNQKEGRVEK